MPVLLDAISTLTYKAVGNSASEATMGNGAHRDQQPTYPKFSDHMWLTQIRLAQHQLCLKHIIY